MNNYEKLCNALKTNPALVTENGDLLKNKVQELARKMDASLLATLLSDSFTEEMFFVDVNGMKVFDANKFTYMVESQSFLPDSYTRFKQNVMLTDGFHSIRKSGDVVLEFPNKDCILEFDSTDTDTSRDEVFLNETLMKKEIDTLLDHKAFCNATRYNSNGSHPTTEISINDNLIIKGNNLLALHTLYPKYKSAIKLMYWDILYNTENDKVPYADSFKHSSWLTMMKNRLEIARNLLSFDGTIWLHCDDNEQAYLKVLCDEIFGRNNFVNCVCVKMYTMSGPKVAHAKNGSRFPKLKEYILIYAKDKVNVSLNIPKIQKEQLTSDYNLIIPEWEEKYINFFGDDISLEDINNKLKNMTVMNLKTYCSENGIKLTDTWIRKNLYRIFASNHNRSLHKALKSKDFSQKLMMISTGRGVRHLITTDFNRASDGTHFDFMPATIGMSYYLGDCWYDNDCLITAASEGGVILPLGQKPEKIIKRIIETATKENDIVLDAYLGSGTTAAVCHKMKRRYIGIEQLDDHSQMGIQRLQNVITGDQSGISKTVNWTGGGSFVFFELAKNSQNILDKIIATDDTNKLSAIYDELKTSPFVLYTVDILKMEKEKDTFAALTIDEQKKFLISIIDKNTLYINFSDIDNGNYSLSDTDKAFTKNFYKEG